MKKILECLIRHIKMSYFVFQSRWHKALYYHHYSKSNECIEKLEYLLRLDENHLTEDEYSLLHNGFAIDIDK